MDRRGESGYAGRDADGNPSGFATMPTARAGEDASYYPAKCAYCSEVLKTDRAHHAHMIVRHPA